MKRAVRDAFFRFTEPFEGWVETLYPDQIGLVTVGLGNLVDPLASALRLPFERFDGTPATTAEIASDWTRVKHLKIPAGASRWRTAARGAVVRLPRAAGEVLVMQKLAANETLLLRLLPNWEEMPADAQMMVLSWAWAVGPAAKYPRMFADIARGDYASAANECTINPDVDTIRLRNNANRVLLRNAAKVVEHGLSAETLYYPHVVGS